MARDSDQPKLSSAHRAIARDVRAGKHVFCEKPMEVSVQKAQRMIDGCEAASRLLGIAYR